MIFKKSLYNNISINYIKHKLYAKLNVCGLFAERKNEIMKNCWKIKFNNISNYNIFCNSFYCMLNQAITHQETKR